MKADFFYRVIIPGAAAIVLALAFLPIKAPADGSASASSPAAYRTDSANPQLPWYQLKGGEFPPVGSEHRVGGDLVEADFIHRRGQFRADGAGELVNFTLLPYSVVYHLNTEADLRDVPLRTHLQFFLYQDEKGDFNKAAVIQDDCTLLAKEGLIYRIDHVQAGRENDGQTKIVVTRQKPGENLPDKPREEFAVDDQTVIWKGDQRIKAGELAGGDEMLADFSENAANDRCAEIWVGADTQEHAAEQQRKKHSAFVIERGLAARIDGVEKKTLAVTLLGDPTSLQGLLKDAGIVPDQFAKEHRQVHAAVANEELRTYNPQVDQQTSNVLQYTPLPTDRYGCSGVQWTIGTNLLVEGFRKGRIIRIFNAGWKIEDMPVGEGLYNERHDARPEEESINQYSYRTDFGNKQLSWYQLKPLKFPPFQSQHLLGGELSKVDAVHRSGQFRVDRTGEVVDFTMPPFGSILYLDALGELSDLPIGNRYFFYLYQDEKGAFTQAAVIEDEFTRMARETRTYRVEAVVTKEHKILLADQLAPLKDDKEHLIQPPDLAHAEFALDDATRVWKADQQIKLSDISAGDQLLINLSGCTTKQQSRCTDIWVGLDTHKQATAAQRQKHDAYLKQNGIPAWIENVDGKRITIAIFAGDRRNFQDVMNGEPGKVLAKLADDRLVPVADRIDTLDFRGHQPDADMAGTYGSAGARWALEADQLPEGYKPGGIVRVFRPEWISHAR